MQETLKALHMESYSKCYALIITYFNLRIEKLLRNLETAEGIEVTRLQGSIKEMRKALSLLAKPQKGTKQSQGSYY